MDPYGAGPAFGGILIVVVFLVVMVLAIGGTAFWIWMLVDAVQVPDDRFFRGGTKTTWVLVVALLGGLGALIYFFAGRPDPETRAYLKQVRETGQQPYGYGPPPSGPPQGWQQPGTPPEGWQQPGTPPEGWQQPGNP